MRKFAISLLLVAGCLGFASARADQAAAAWAALASGGHVIVVRHANAAYEDGACDIAPTGIEGCTKQRRLDVTGRRQAVALGEAIRAHHVVVDKVLTSAWCRTQETAKLMNLGPTPEVTPMWRRVGVRLADREEAEAEIRELVSQWKGPGALVIVMHGAVFDIGHPAEQGEMTVLKPLPNGGVQVIGAIDPPK